MKSLTLPDKNLSEGITQLIREQEQYCLDRLEQTTAHNRHETIHELRKTFKKLRAIFRFIRDEIGEEAYQAENTFYRDLGRQISELRDSTAIIEALVQIKDGYADGVTDKVFEMPLQSLKARRKKLTDKYVRDEQRLVKLEDAIRNKIEGEKGRKLEFDTFGDISSGIERVYKRGRKAFEKARQTKDTRDLHEWRKRVKYLRYQHDILSVVWPRIIDARATELDRLGGFLGTDHDLSVLQEQIEQAIVKFSNETEQGLTSALISWQRQQLQKEALLLGANFYQETPEDFAEKIRVWWMNYQEKLSLKAEV